MIDPFNIIITGVGGQGNVLAARMLGNTLAKSGYHVTIGETFGASQRGGSVMSHLRVSKESAWSPQIPKGRAHLIIALEPIESLRVLAAYGNRDVVVISNTRPIYPVGVISGDFAYPSLPELNSAMGELCDDKRFINATEEALSLGNPILGNVIMVGAAAGTGLLSIEDSSFESVISENVPASKVKINMEAYRKGKEMVKAPIKF
ncbi:MAG TPA: indolepyruvate oxidoreductase subunit beta [Spirochaetota bacterium]|nr:indolepyruvate oxidoreductase subunit beta [Spirochaetota bacterium]HPJ35289.1 indolepyruvate oxidoreductase subunit beta [Spirochaetota bacterium]